MGDKLIGGTQEQFAGSMAAAMEEALNALLVAEGRPPVSTDPSAETRDRRVLFLAVAQGIVRHLGDNQAAFVAVDDGGVALPHQHMSIGH
jgi:hypothetical protein